MTQPDDTKRSTGGGVGSGLTAKVGPLPTWAWIGLATVGGVVVLLWLRSRKASQQSTSDTSAVSPDTATVGNLQDQLAVIASQLRDVQGGTSTPPTDTTSPTQTAVIVEGQGLNAFLQKYHVTLDQLLALNPDIAQYLRTSNASGYGPGGPDSLVFNVGATPVIVKVPLVTQTPPTIKPITTTTSGHAVG